MHIQKHKSEIDPKTKSINQKLRTLGPEKKKAVLTEIAKLKKNGFIREIKYLRWLSNIVIVKNL